MKSALELMPMPAQLAFAGPSGFLFMGHGPCLNFWPVDGDETRLHVMAIDSAGNVSGWQEVDRVKLPDPPFRLYPRTVTVGEDGVSCGSYAWAHATSASNTGRHLLCRAARISSGFPPRTSASIA